MFRETNDGNLNLLLELHDRLEDTMNSFANINNITQEELDDFEEDELQKYCDFPLFLL